MAGASPELARCGTVPMSPTGPGTPRNGSLSPCRCISCLHVSSAEPLLSENGAVAAVVLGLSTHLGHQALSGHEPGAACTEPLPRPPCCPPGASHEVRPYGNIIG